MPESLGHETVFARVYLDRHIMRRLAVDLRGLGFDVLTTEAAGKDTASDEQQLGFATAERRAILTFNIRDFAPLHDDWRASGRIHAGILVSRQLGGRQYGLLLQRMLRLLNHISQPRKWLAISCIWNSSSRCAARDHPASGPNRSPRATW